MYIVAMLVEGKYQWFGTFETEEAAETFAIKFENAIVIYNVEGFDND